MKYIKYMWKKNIEPKIFDKKKCFQSQLNFIIESNKQKYYSDLSTKLADPITSLQNPIDQLWRCFWMMKYSLYSTFKLPKYKCNRFF